MPKVDQAHLDARRTQILEAASQCFSRDGLHGTTIQNIIRQSGLSAGAIYSYFASKDEIIEAINAERHARERESITAACRGADLRNTLEQLSQYFFGSLRQADERERRRVGIQLWAEALRNQRILAIVREGVDEPRKLLAGLIENAQRRGNLRPDLSADAVARVLIALYHGFILQQAWDEQAELEAFLAVVDAALGPLFRESPGSSAG